MLGLARAVWLPVLFAASSIPASAENPDFSLRLDAEVKPLVEEYCISCHSDEKTKGDINLEQLPLGRIGRRAFQDLGTGDRYAGVRGHAPGGGAAAFG